MRTKFQDYYATLGVPKTATQKEIKAAFRKLARQHHPDVNNQSPASVEKFKAINEANEVLGDPEKRKKYDQLGPQWEQYQQWEQAGSPGGQFPGGVPFGAGAFPGGAGNAHYTQVNPDELESMFGTRSPFSPFFNMFFGGSPRAPQRGSDVEGEAQVTLQEALAGTSRVMELNDGSAIRRIEVRIPAGVRDGARVRAAGQGSRGEKGHHGDLYVRVRVMPDSRFMLEGRDIRTRVAVPLAVALLGGAVQVATPRGGAVELKIPAGTQNRTQLRLRGLGMPDLQGAPGGDLIAEVDVRLPELRTDAARDAAARLRDTTS